MRSCRAHAVAALLPCADVKNPDPCRRVRRVTIRSGSQSWPRAAWWMRGSPRVASLCCDAPVKTPLTPLHLFIKTLGPLPPTQALTTYINRLRENGFNMWKTVQKAIDCGANVDSEISRVVRINVRSPLANFEAAPCNV